MTADLARSVRLIDYDRRQIANAGIYAANRIGNSAMRFCASAARFGHDPVFAARAVLFGNEVTKHASVPDLLAHTMLVSNLKGRRRTVLNARGHIEPIQLARGDKKLSDDEAALLALLLLTVEETADLRAFYLMLATKLVDTSVAGLLEDLRTASPAEIRGAFIDAGIAGETPYQIDNLFQTAGVRGYEDGRYEASQNEQIQDALFGYRYSAILDDRTTELCQTLDGTILPKDDPFWIRWKPPNHFRCRSVIVEVWQNTTLRNPTPVPLNATIEQLARFAAEKSRFLSYF